MLHRFLQVYGNFDWDRLCLTLQGPISLEKLQRREGALQLWLCHAVDCTLPPVVIKKWACLACTHPNGGVRMAVDVGKGGS